MNNGGKNLYSMLNLPITELAFSESFILRTKLMGFFCLNDIIKCDLVKLQEHEDYSDLWYDEFIKYIHANKLAFLIKKSSD